MIDLLQRKRIVCGINLFIVRRGWGRVERIL